MHLQTLLAEGINLPKYGFGGANRLSLHGHLAAVGAPGAEAVFLYRRNVTTGAAGGGSEDMIRGVWGQWPVKTFTSPDFDYDVVLLRKTVHRQVRQACGVKASPIYYYCSGLIMDSGISGEHMHLPPILSTCALHISSGCGKREARINWSMVTCQGSNRYWNHLPCAGGLSAVNAIGTQMRDSINSGLTQWHMAI